MNIKTKKSIKSVLKQISVNEGWGLCIGAGTSYPLFPTWPELVERLIKKDISLADPDAVSKSLLKQFSPDTLIQAVQNRLELNDAEFANILSDELYAPMKSLIPAKEWESIKTIFESRNPHLQKDPVWNDYIAVREKYFKTTSAYALSKFVHHTIELNIPPEVIISFNAESLLFSMINSFEREKYIEKVKKTGEMVTYLDRLTHSISDQKKGKIKYIFCHGLLLAPLSKKMSPLLTASDKLVFSESAYLNIAHSTFSWQSTEFVSHCLNKTMIFIGVSLTDPNMRRWLSWIQKIKETEIIENVLFAESIKNKTYSHYWINKQPKNKEEKSWIEACVSHLGIKIIWISTWESLSDVLNEMIG